MKRYCVKCGKEIKLIEPQIPTNKPEDAMWDGGIIDRIAAGYGSVLDGDIFIIAICDDCIKSK